MPVPGPDRSAAPAPAPDKDGPPESPPPNLADVPDAEPRVEPIKPGGPNKPYEVAGQRYEPSAADVPLAQRAVLLEGAEQVEPAPGDPGIGIERLPARMTSVPPA